MSPTRSSRCSSCGSHSRGANSTGRPTIPTARRASARPAQQEGGGALGRARQSHRAVKSHPATLLLRRGDMPYPPECPKMPGEPSGCSPPGPARTAEGAAVVHVVAHQPTQTSVMLWVLADQLETGWTLEVVGPDGPLPPIRAEVDEPVRLSNVLPGQSPVQIWTHLLTGLTPGADYTVCAEARSWPGAPRRRPSVRCRRTWPSRSPCCWVPATPRTATWPCR